MQGITPNVDIMAAQVHNSIGLATALNPYLGYAIASEIARDALLTNRSVADIVLERGYLSEEQLRHILAPERLANLSVEPGQMPVDVLEPGDESAITTEPFAER